MTHSEQFEFEANIIRNRSSFRSCCSQRTFKELFGISSYMCSLVWNIIYFKVPRNCEHKHLLWALLFLKQYATESTHSALAQVDPKTFRKWSWTLITILSNLKLVCWDDRKQGIALLNCYASVDGTDVPIEEQSPFDGKWYSHKLNAAGLRYELGIGINFNNIVSLQGPFPAGSYTDLRIFRLGMKKNLLQHELVIADNGYGDERCIKRTEMPQGFRSLGNRIRARHETVNGRLKCFRVLATRFRHDLKMHSPCFYAVANITYLVIKHEEPLWSLNI